MTLNIKLISRLREETGAPVVRIKQVLDQFNQDEKKALEVLKKEGFEKAAKRTDRETGQGVIASYVHHTKKVASIVEVLCETDFVARNGIFQELAQNIAMQVASMNAKDEKDLLNQEFIKDPRQKVADLIKAVIAKTGENVKIGRFCRIEIGK